MSIQNFAQDEQLLGNLVCRDCGYEDVEEFCIQDLPLTCPICQQQEFRPQLGLDAERV